MQQALHWWKEDKRGYTTNISVAKTSHDYSTSFNFCTAIFAFSPSAIVYHDHSYCAPLSVQSYVPPAHLTPLLESSIPLSPSSINAQTQTSTCTSHFCIEDIADNDMAIHFYTGFSDYRTLVIFFEFLGKSLKYWGSKSTIPSLEKRGASRSLTPLNELFLVLCRLRCGLTEIDLAYRFEISVDRFKNFCYLDKFALFQIKRS